MEPVERVVPHFREELEQARLEDIQLFLEVTNNPFHRPRIS